MPGKLCRTGRLRAVAVFSLVLLAGELAAHAQPQPTYLVKDLDNSPPSGVPQVRAAQTALGQH